MHQRNGESDNHLGAEQLTHTSNDGRMLVSKYNISKPIHVGNNKPYNKNVRFFCS